MDATDLMPALIFPNMPGWGELLIIAFIGLLLFGRRLPEVGRSLGKGIVEFKKGLRGVNDEIEKDVNKDSTEHVLPRSQSHESDEARPDRATEKAETRSDQ